MPRKTLPIVAILLPVLGVCGCRQDRGIRTGDPGICSHDALSLWVANAGDSSYPESARPRLSNVEVWVDGAKSDAEAKIVVFCCKLGWSERADFSVPETARSGQVRAHVTSGKRRYLVTQNWAKQPEGWTVESDSIQPASD